MHAFPGLRPVSPADLLGLFFFASVLGEVFASYCRSDRADIVLKMS